MNTLSEGWIVWNGDHTPPVEKGVLVDVKYRGGAVNLHVKALTPFPESGGSDPDGLTAEDWGNDPHEFWPMDIVAYRLHKEAMTKFEWVTRCQKRLSINSHTPQWDWSGLAETLYGNSVQDFPDDPEGCADEEISCWDDQGD